MADAQDFIELMSKPTELSPNQNSISFIDKDTILNKVENQNKTEEDQKNDEEAQKQKERIDSLSIKSSNICKIIIGEVFAILIMSTVMYAMVIPIVDAMTNEFSRIYNLYQLLSSLQINIESLSSNIAQCNFYNSCSNFDLNYINSYKILDQITSAYLSPNQYFAFPSLDVSASLCELANSHDAECVLAFGEISKMGFYNNIHYLLSGYNKYYLLKLSNYSEFIDYETIYRAM